jgi:hypothetical protein
LVIVAVKESPAAQVQSMTSSNIGNFVLVQRVNPGTYPWTEEIWFGAASAVGTSTVTVNFNTGVSGLYTSFTAQEFSYIGGLHWKPITLGGQLNQSSTIIDFPSIDSAPAGSLYIGYAAAPYAISDGNTAGFTYETDATNDVMVFNTSTATALGTVRPEASQTPAGFSLSQGIVLTFFP